MPGQLSHRATVFSRRLRALSLGAGAVRQCFHRHRPMDMQVLHELSKHPELGKYAAEVADLIRRERLG